MREVSLAVDELERDSSVGCLVVTGSEKAFAAGAKTNPRDKNRSLVFRKSITSNSTTAIIATIEKNHLCQPEASAKKLKAAPGFIVNTIARNGKTSFTSYGPIVAMMIRFVY
jgi:enoyl-CoA hydratase/carnithine racemase